VLHSDTAQHPYLFGCGVSSFLVFSTSKWGGLLLETISVWWSPKTEIPTVENRAWREPAADHPGLKKRVVVQIPLDSPMAAMALQGRFKSLAQWAQAEKTTSSIICLLKLGTSQCQISRERIGPNYPKSQIRLNYDVSPSRNQVCLRYFPGHCGHSMIQHDPTVRLGALQPSSHSPPTVERPTWAIQARRFFSSSGGCT